MVRQVQELEVGQVAIFVTTTTSLVLLALAIQKVPTSFTCRLAFGCRLFPTPWNWILVQVAHCFSGFCLLSALMRVHSGKDRKEMMLKTLFTTKAKKIGDTNFRLVDMLNVRRQLLDGKTLVTRCLVKSGVVHAAAFPPTLSCCELVLECTSRFDMETRFCQGG